MKYIVNWPNIRGWPWALINEKGQVLVDRHSIGGKNDAIILANIIAAMQRGIYTDAAHKIPVFPCEDNGYKWLEGKRKNCTALGKLYAQKRARGNTKGLRSISEENRYKGKVDWEAERQHITDWMTDGLSLGQIARRLGVSPSTLSEANKRHNLYPPQKRVA